MDSKSTKNNFKIISIALIISILLQVLMPIMIPLKSFAATDEEPYIIKTQYNQIIKFTSKVHEMKAGDIVPVEVEVTVSNLLSLSVNLIYDKEIFEIVNVDYYEDTTQNIKWQQAGFAEQGEEGQFIYARSYGEKPTSGTFVLMTINLKVKETVQGTLDSANLQFKYVTPEDSENSTDMGPNGDGNGYEKEIELPVPLKTTDITYNANVPEGVETPAENVPETGKKEEGTPYTIAAGPTLPGYRFIEWNIAQSGNGGAYKAGTEYTTDTALTLYAQWVKEYTLTLDADGGTYEGDREIKGIKDEIKQIPAPTTAPEGHTITLNMNDGTANPATEELKQEKTFEKWERTEGVGTADGRIFTFGEGNATAKAIYKSEKVPLTVPTRSGYEFKGWYTTADPTQGEKVDMSYMPEGNVTLYASWEKVEEEDLRHTLTINAGEGTYIGETERKGLTNAIIQIGEAKAPKGHTIKINPNNGEAITQVEQKQSFDKWEKTGAGAVNGTAFTFGEGNAEVTAKYKLDKVELQEPENKGYEIEGWYTTTNEELNPETDTKIDPSNYIPEQDETVYPNWVEKEYKITYRNIKGSDNSQNPEKYTINSGTLEIKNLADQEKYTFKGWYLTEEGTGEKITSINVAELENLEDIELYAQWEEIQITEVKIKYNANGENVQNVPAEVTQEKGTIYRIAAAPTREGYKFMGWCITADGADLTYQPGNSYKANEDLELYAIWAKITTTEVEIKYEKNVPEAEVNTVSNMPNNTTKAEGAVHTIPEAIPTREGYVFAGWNISKDGDKAGYNPGSKYTEDANLTLFAQWEKEYTLTVDPDVETYEGDREVKGIKDDLKQIPAPTVAPEGHTVTLNINDGTQNPTETTVKQTKTFDKWERTTGVGTVNGEVFTFGEGNATIKAIYKLDEVTPEVPTRAGYIFKGWYTTADPRQGEKVDMPFVPEEDITIYADWEKEPEEEVQYTLTVKPNGGTYIGDTEIKGAYNSTKQIGIPSEAPKGHTIIIDTNNGQTATEVEQTQSFDKWERTSGVGTVNGTAFKFGEGNAEVTAKYKLDKVELGTPEKTGYEIEGWYTTSTPTATPNPETDTKIDPENYIPTKDEKVYVNWKEKEYKITYNNTKDSDISQHPLKYTIKDETIELKDLPDQEKYIFKGWYATAEGTGEKITSIDISKLEKMEDIELYAKWEEKEPETETLYLKSAKYKVGEKDIDNYEKGDVYLDKIEPLTTVAKLKENCEHNGTLTVLDAQGQALKDDDLVGTGMTIRVEGHNDKFELTAVVMGDLDGNGKVTATDLSALNQAILKEITLEGASFKAADLDDSEKITATDLSTINNVILKNLVLTFIKKIS